MRYFLVQAGQSDALRTLKRLESLLPESIVAKATLAPFGEGSPDGAPERVVATLESDDRDEVALVRQSVAALGQPDFTLRDSPPVIAPEPDSADPVQSLIGLMPMPMGLTEANRAAQETTADEIFKELMALFTSTDDPVPFPEEAYSGAEKTAYDHIVGVLGTEPRIDRGQDFEPGRIRAIKRPRRIRVATWEKVVEHLEVELLHFRRCRDWLGETGHIQTLRDRQKAINLGFLKDLNDKYLGIGAGVSVPLGVSTMMSFSFKVISWLPEFGPAVSGALAALWQIGVAAKGGPNVTVKAKIAQMENELHLLWVQQMGELERQLVRMTSDWRLLSIFGGMVASHRLVWPDEKSDLRRAFSHSYQLSAMRDTMRYGDSGAEHVRRDWERVDKKTGEGWARRKNGDFDYALRSQSGKSGDFRYFYYIGHRIADPFSGGIQYYHAGWPIQRKLFGTDTSSETDPELAIPARFLTQPKCAERKGWDLPQYTG